MSPALLTLDLKNVTAEDVMSTVRDVYGYEYRYARCVPGISCAHAVTGIQGRLSGYRTQRRIAYACQFRTGITGTLRRRFGGTNSSSTSGVPTAVPTAAPGGQQSGSNDSFSGAQVTTRTTTDFWDHLEKSLQILIGEENGRKLSPIRSRVP